jgi:hypothetical protein
MRDGLKLRMVPAPAMKADPAPHGQGLPVRQDRPLVSILSNIANLIFCCLPVTLLFVIPQQDPARLRPIGETHEQD